ncbi:TNKS2 [Symbiodinium natans]|uniref:TNKS2 protein n=1 Tax=Symbiodinium natans TaxID=878477 RepID=A0A812KU21_9DINO|nr:TNKS2 [Symbiodinium natans]
MQGRRPSKTLKPKPKATRKSVKKPTLSVGVQKIKAGKGSQVSPDEAQAVGHLVMLLKAKKMRSILNTAPPPQLPISALNEAHPETGLTPLALALAHGHVSLVPSLVSLKADVNAPDPKGDTPLIMAATTGDVAAIAALIEAGASLTQKNKDGRQALDLASTVPARAALMTSTVRKIAGLPRPVSASLAPIRRRRSSAAVHHRFRLEDLPDTLGTADLLEGHIRSLLRRVGAPRPDVLDIPVDPIRQKAKGLAYLEYADNAAADKAENMFEEAQDQKGPMGTMARLVREGTVPARRPSTPGPRGH